MPPIRTHHLLLAALVVLDLGELGVDDVLATGGRTTRTGIAAAFGAALGREPQVAPVLAALTPA